MTDHSPLDRQVWNMLHGELRHLASGSSLARRIDPTYGPFAAAKDQSEAAQAALTRLLESNDDHLWLVEPDIWQAPDSTEVIRTAEVLQLVADTGASPPTFDDITIEALRADDAAEMMALARLTEPGPWASNTHLYGQFFGVRFDGNIVSMAGERMRPSPEHAEVSGVCTLPEFRGRGLARRLIARVMANQIERGVVPYLHSYAGNDAAIGLYKSLGFRPRRRMFVTILAKA